MAQRVVIPGFRKIETSGGGEGGTGNYNDLTNKPSINNVPLVGNLSTVDLKLTDKTLTEEGVPAEAKTVGTKLEEQSTSLTAVKEELTKKANISDIPTKVSELQNDSNYQTDTDVTTTLATYATKTYVGEQISSADHLKREIVTEIPSPETADKNTIYMLKIESAMGEDKYKEYLLIDGTVQCIGDTSVDLTDYAKKTEIPTELPANGGNSATVNGHTVKSDVPENAVFTDTIYDDTEVKESISAQSTEIISIKNTANFSHNIPRNVPKDITSYITDGTFYKRLNGTDGFELFENIYVGDYIKMSRAITCPDSTDGTVGSQYVTIAGLDTMMYNGKGGKYVNYHHAVMVPGQGFEGIQHFGRHAMNATNTTDGGYAASVMNQSVLGAVATEGSTASGATINQQLYAEFGSHLKTTDELLSTGINATGTNRFGTANGCSNNWGWHMRQAVLMSEVEVYGSTVWSSSGYDTGSAKMQLPLFAHSRNAMNDRSSWYWLKDVASSASFCICGNNGNANYDDAGNSWHCVRPRFIIS